MHLNDHDRQINADRLRSAEAKFSSHPIGSAALLATAGILGFTLLGTMSDHRASDSTLVSLIRIQLTGSPASQALVRSARHFYSLSSKSLSVQNGVSILRDEVPSRPAAIVSNCEFEDKARPQGAIRFTGKDSFLELPSSQKDHPPRFTLCAWVKLTGDSDGSVIDKADWKNNGARGFGLRIIRRKANAFVGKRSWQAIDSSKELPLNEWVHLAATYNGATLRLYINGEADRSKPIAGPIEQSDYPYRIGNATYEEGQDRFLPGLAADAGIFLRALTAEEIRELMQR